MPKTYDCIVIGVGGFGSGVLDHLAMSGLRVLGIEQFEIAHDQGSSHGDTRIIRKAYFEHPDYVPLLLRAYELWDDLEADHGQKLREECGLLLAGPPNGDTVTGAKLSSKLHGLSLDEMTANEAMQRFPGFSIPDEHTAVYEPEAGFLHVEECVRAHTARSQRNSAELHVGETVLSWQSKNGSIRVKTNQGEYEAGQLVITAGPWADLLLKELAVPLEVVRKPLFWHASEKSDYHLVTGIARIG